MPSPEITPLTSAQLPACAALFAHYPYKFAQQHFQHLDRDRLNAFYLANLEKSVTAGTPHWVAQADAQQPVALAGLSGESWHSGIYGLRMAKVQPWLNTQTPTAGAALLETVLNAARAQNLEHLSVRLDGEDFANLHLFTHRDFYLVDVSLKFARLMPVEPLAVPPAAAGLHVGLATPDDYAWIRRLGSTTHGGTHFLNDPHLPHAQTEALFSAWLERCLNGLAYRVYVVKDAAGAGVGFVTYLRAGAFARAVGRTPIILDFVLIDPARRGGGLGPWFIAETLARETPLPGEPGFDYCELRTSAHNLSAVINYEKLGFRCCATDFVLHHRLA
jgi:GNAT superfamily N-acetyltransferase